MRRPLTILLVLVTLAAVLTIAASLKAEHRMSPMVAQTMDSLALNYEFDRWSPLWARGLLAVGLVVLAAAWWRGRGEWRWKSYLGATFSALALAGAVAATHVYRVEVMLFKPLSEIAYVPISEYEHDDASDGPVMGVAIGDEARAYPVQTMIYHHIANDIVGGQPIVATY